jgi:hypothetical protein
VGFDRLKADKVPVFNAKAAADLGARMGEFFRVEGKIASRRPLTLETGGNKYSLWASDKESDALRPIRKLPVGSEVELIGLLSTHIGKPQFLIEDPSWILEYEAADKDKD